MPLRVFVSAVVLCAMGVLLIMLDSASLNGWQSWLVILGLIITGSVVFRGLRQALGGRRVKHY